MSSRDHVLFHNFGDRNVTTVQTFEVGTALSRLVCGPENVYCIF